MVYCQVFVLLQEVQCMKYRVLWWTWHTDRRGSVERDSASVCITLQGKTAAEEAAASEARVQRKRPHPDQVEVEALQALQIK